MFVLTVDVHQQLAQLAQHLHGHRPAVDIPLGGFVDLDHAAHETLALVEQVVLHEPLRRVVLRREFKAGGDLAALAAMAHHAALGARPQHQGQGIDEDGFAGAGFAGEYREPGAQAQLELVHDGEIANIEMVQHVRISRPSGVWPGAHHNDFCCWGVSA